MGAELKIAKGLAVPVGLVGESVAILAKRNAGKTYTASVLIEELVKANQQVVVLDPVGVHYGLASNAKGDGPGLPVIVLGGEHGALPLARSAGAIIADLAVDSWPQSYVLDLSDFESDAAQDQFAAEFAHRLYRRKARAKHPVMLVLEEADAFAPQAPMPDQRRMLGAFTTIARRGRSRGLGYMAVTQRTAALHKDLTSQAELLIVMQIIGSHDRKAIEEWVKGNATEEERAAVLGSLASLEQGEGWVWSPGWLKICERVRFRKRETFDASRSPSEGEDPVQVTALAEVDLGLVRERIEAAMADQTANDPKLLRKRIADLERRLADGHTTVVKPEIREIEIQVEVVPESMRVSVEELAERVNRLLNDGADYRELPRLVEGIASISELLVAHVTDIPRMQEARSSRVEAAAPPVRAAAVPARRNEPVAASGPQSDRSELSTGARGLLEVLERRHPMALTLPQLATMGGRSRRSSSFRPHVRELVDGGFAIEDGNRVVAASSSGAPPQTRDEVIETWMRAMPPAGQRMLRALCDGTSYNREALAQASQISRTSSALGGTIKLLKDNGLLEEREGLYVAGGALA